MGPLSYALMGPTDFISRFFSVKKEEKNYKKMKNKME